MPSLICKVDPVELMSELGEISIRIVSADFFSEIKCVGIGGEYENVGRIYTPLSRIDL